MTDHQFDDRRDKDDRRAGSQVRELEQALSDRARFIARLSHEMRSPLHAIQGLSEVLLDSEEIRDDDRRHIESIGKEASSLRRMIDDLLDMSKIGAGHMELLTEPFTPAALCDEIGLAHRPRAESKGLDLRIEIGPGVPRIVIGDRHRVRQILVNLIGNAIKYTDTGHVEVRLEADPENPETRIRPIRFVISDTGRGIPEDKAAYLFEPYRQLHSSDSAKGTGIGLTISRMLTELMGGSIDFESSPSGTTFVCELPMREGRRASDRATVAKELNTKTSGASGASILVVDDSDVNRLLAAAQVKRLGHESTLVASGHDALTLIELSSFDVILMDWHMPELDGLETTRRIRALGDSISQPHIIAMTASVMSGDRDECLAAGMDDYLAKPVSLTDLGEMFDRWIGAKDAENDASEDGSAVDDEAIDRLVAELGGADPAHSILMTFLTELSGWRIDLENGVATGDLDTARRAAHTVKSTASMLGAEELATACESFESGATDPETAKPLLEHVLVSADSATEALHQKAERLQRTDGRGFNSSED